MVNLKYAIYSHNETPRFQGIKSSWLSCTAFGTTVPDAARMQYANISSPICSMVLSPVTIGPQSMSIISSIRRASWLLVATLITGQTGLPVGVPRLVVTKINVAPLEIGRASGRERVWQDV